MATEPFKATVIDDKTGGAYSCCALVIADDGYRHYGYGATAEAALAMVKRLMQERYDKLEQEREERQQRVASYEIEIETHGISLKEPA